MGGGVAGEEGGRWEERLGTLVRAVATVERIVELSATETAAARCTHGAGASSPNAITFAAKFPNGETVRRN